MGMKLTGEIQGLDGFIKKLSAASAKYTAKYLRKAMTKSGRSVAKEASAGAPQRSGQLARSMGSKTKVYPSGVVVGIVEPRAGFRTLYGNRSGTAVASGSVVKLSYIDPRRYAHLVESGTRPRFNRKGAYRGVMPPTPFLGRAFEANRERVAIIFAATMHEALVDMVT